MLVEFISMLANELALLAQEIGSPVLLLVMLVALKVMFCDVKVHVMPAAVATVMFTAFMVRLLTLFIMLMPAVVPVTACVFT